MRPGPEWDVLICADEEDKAAHAWFPAMPKISDGYILPLEGLRFRNCYLTNRTIEKGSANLFHTLYHNALMCKGKVLHVTDYRESE